MLNYIWLALILLAVMIGGFDHKLKEVGEAPAAPRMRNAA